MDRPVFRQLIPHTDPRCVLLRIYVDSVDEYPILAWDIRCYVFPRPNGAPPLERTEVLPVTIDELCSNAIECVVLPSGLVDRSESCLYASRFDAIAECQAELRQRGEK